MDPDVPVLRLRDPDSLEALLSGVDVRTKPTVVVTCDRCGKRLGVLGYLGGEFGQVVLLDVHMALLFETPHAATGNWLTTEMPGQRGRRNAPYAVACPQDGRWRFKAVCLGGRNSRRRPVSRGRALERHQLREVTVTTETAERAYRAAVDADRSRITMYELEIAGRSLTIRS